MRLRAFSGNLGERFVIANIPAAAVETVENGRWRPITSPASAGSTGSRRSCRPRATDIDFNPYWTVPASIIRKDLIPRMQADPQYLTRKSYPHLRQGRARRCSRTPINWNSLDAVNYRFRQDPGADFNSLGVVRINIPNPYGVYMHDTPEKGIFGDDFRFVSSGCMRVQDIRDYVAWLLKDNPGWDRDHIDEVDRVRPAGHVKLEPPVNVYWVYITAWAHARRHRPIPRRHLPARRSRLGRLRRDAPSQPLKAEQAGPSPHRRCSRASTDRAEAAEPSADGRTVAAPAICVRCAMQPRAAGLFVAGGAVFTLWKCVLGAIGQAGACAVIFGRARATEDPDHDPIRRQLPPDPLPTAFLGASRRGRSGDRRARSSSNSVASATRSS